MFGGVALISPPPPLWEPWRGGSALWRLCYTLALIKRKYASPYRRAPFYLCLRWGAIATLDWDSICACAATLSGFFQSRKPAGGDLPSFEACGSLESRDLFVWGDSRNYTSVALWPVDSRLGSLKSVRAEVVHSTLVWQWLPGMGLLNTTAGDKHPFPGNRELYLSLLRWSLNVFYFHADKKRCRWRSELVQCQIIKSEAMLRHRRDFCVLVSGGQLQLSHIFIFLSNCLWICTFSYMVPFWRHSCMWFKMQSDMAHCVDINKCGNCITPLQKSLILSILYMRTNFLYISI